MLPYILMVFSVLVIPLCLPKNVVTKVCTGKSKRVICGGYLVALIVLLFFSTFRGAFSRDYNQYLYNLYLYGNVSFDVKKIFDAGQEPLFVLFYWLLGHSSYREFMFLFITSFVVEIGYFRRLIKDSEIPWISILCFVLIGGYLASFNMIRQMVACAVTLFAMDYMYNRQFIKYILVIIIAALIHTTALIMLIVIPIYYYRPRKIIDTLLFVVFSMSLLLFCGSLITYIQRFIYSEYNDYSYQAMAPISINKILLMVVILLFSFISLPRLVKCSEKEQLWYKLSLVCAVLLVGSLQMKNFERIATYFYPYVCLLFPAVIKRQEDKYRTVIILVFSALSVVYMVVTIYGSAYYPYQFASFL